MIRIVDGDDDAATMQINSNDTCMHGVNVPWASNSVLWQGIVPAETTNLSIVPWLSY